MAKMGFFERVRQLPRHKTRAQLEAHYDQLEMKKGDFPAMIIAAITAIVPFLLIIFGALWLIMKLFRVV